MGEAGRGGGIQVLVELDRRMAVERSGERKHGRVEIVHDARLVEPDFERLLPESRLQLLEGLRGDLSGRRFGLGGRSRGARRRDGRHLRSPRSKDCAELLHGEVSPLDQELFEAGEFEACLEGIALGLQARGSLHFVEMSLPHEEIGRRLVLELHFLVADGDREDAHLRGSQEMVLGQDVGEHRGKGAPGEHVADLLAVLDLRGRQEFRPEGETDEQLIAVHVVIVPYGSGVGKGTKRGGWRSGLQRRGARGR